MPTIIINEIMHNGKLAFITKMTSGNSKGHKDGELMPSWTLKNLCRMGEGEILPQWTPFTCAALFLSTWLCTLLSPWRTWAHQKEVYETNWHYAAQAHQSTSQEQKSESTPAFTDWAPLGEQLHGDDSPVSQFFQLGIKRSMQACQLLKDSCGLLPKGTFSALLS